MVKSTTGSISDLSPPGDMLSEVLEERGMTAAELARRTGRSEKHISELLRAKTTLSLDVAIELEQVLGIPAQLWKNLEFNYRSELRRREIREKQKTYSDWMRSFPVRPMIKAGYIEDVGQAALGRVEALLDFFGVTSPEAWQAEWGVVAARFRQSHTYTPDFPALTAWLRRGELEAQRIDCSAYDREAFTAALGVARSLTLEEPHVFSRRLREVCAAAGVAFAVVPSLPKLAISGASRWLGETALLQLSLRHKSDDQFWFSFFHEAFHVLEHRSNTIFLDMADGETDSDEEKQADTFASDFLIPASSYAEFIDGRKLTASSIHEFASSIDVAPGIVVGRLQHDGHVPFNRFNELKARFQWTFDAPGGGQ